METSLKYDLEHQRQYYCQVKKQSELTIRVKILLNEDWDICMPMTPEI
jgi:hypothetical protein